MTGIAGSRAESAPPAGEFAAGWRVLTAGIFGVAASTTAIPFYSLGVFVPALEAAHGWSRTEISVAALLLGFGLPVSLLYVGRLIDRFGIRAVAVSGHFVLGAAFVALGFVESKWAFWGLYAAAALLAAGASPVTYTRAVIGAFEKHRGLALGICLAGAGLGALVSPLLLAPIVERQGWTAGYFTLGTAVLAVGLLALWLLPGREPDSAARRAIAQRVVRAPLDSRLLWLCATFFVLALGVNGLLVHFVAALLDGGLTMESAARTAALIGVTVILGRIVAGLLLDHVPFPWVALAILGVGALGIGAYAVVGVEAAIVTALAIGFVVGAEVDLLSFLLARIYPREVYARSHSRVYSAFMLGTGLSPLLAGWVYGQLGSYAYFFGFSAAVCVITAAVLMRVGAAPAGARA